MGASSDPTQTEFSGKVRKITDNYALASGRSRLSDEASVSQSGQTRKSMFVEAISGSGSVISRGREV